MPFVFRLLCRQKPRITPKVGRICLVAALWVVAALPAVAMAGDWPQILGPRRDGQAVDEQLLDAWPADGPRQLWKREIGAGYAGPAIVGDKVILFHRVENNERVEALDAGTGKSLWQADYPATYRGGINPDTGPRCVPLVAGGRVYTFGAGGDLHCTDLASGKKLWVRGLSADYESTDGYFGAGSTPILVEGKLLVNLGGRDGAGLVALAPDTGKTLWTATDEAASYSSPTAIRFRDRLAALFVTRMNAVCVDPRNGEVLFQFPFGKRGPTVNAATPLVFDGHLFVTASYGVGALVAKVAENDVKEVWSNDEVMSSQYNTGVYHDGYLYGINGREDIGTAELVALAAHTGKVAWRETDFGVAHLILADGKLLIVTGAGGLHLAKASPARYEELAKASLPFNVVRAIPALSNGRLVIRSNSAPAQLIALEVGK